MIVTPDGYSRIEMSRFLAPPVVAVHRSAPVNALGYLRVMFTEERLVRERITFGQVKDALKNANAFYDASLATETHRLIQALD